MKDVKAGAAPPGDEAASSWWQAAYCAGRPELFFPPVGLEPDQQRRKREAAAIGLCRRCSIRARCLDYSLRHDIRSGIWGGRTERDRAEATGRQGPVPRAKDRP
jgi:WhiB family redox-sensing transcriptional regulator